MTLRVNASQRPAGHVALGSRADEHALYLARLVINAPQGSASDCGTADLGQQQPPGRGRIGPGSRRVRRTRSGREVAVDQVKVFRVPVPVPRDKGAEQDPGMVEFSSRCRLAHADDAFSAHLGVPAPVRYTDGGVRQTALVVRRARPYLVRW